MSPTLISLIRYLLNKFIEIYLLKGKDKLWLEFKEFLLCNFMTTEERRVSQETKYK